MDKRVENGGMDMVAEDTAVAAILLDAAAKDIDINQSII
jgi:hypothetical protein